jgi:hypothetical protein
VTGLGLINRIGYWGIAEHSLTFFSLNRFSAYHPLRGKKSGSSFKRSIDLGQILKVLLLFVGVFGVKLDSRRNTSFPTSACGTWSTQVGSRFCWLLLGYKDPYLLEDSE